MKVCGGEAQREAPLGGSSSKSSQTSPGQSCSQCHWSQPSTSSSAGEGRQGLGCSAHTAGLRDGPHLQGHTRQPVTPSQRLWSALSAVLQEGAQRLPSSSCIPWASCFSFPLLIFKTFYFFLIVGFLKLNRTNRKRKPFFSFLFSWALVS